MIERTLEEANPKLSLEWHPTKNGKLTPADVAKGSSKKVWWRCSKGHDWQATVNNRNNGKGCPYCAGKAVCDDNCLATINPELAKQWHFTKNLPLTPQHVRPGSHKKVWWMCDKGHKWEAVINNRNNGTDCPKCRGRKSKTTERSNP